MHFGGLALTALEGGLKGVGRIFSAGYIQNVANVANPSFKVSFVSEVFFLQIKVLTMTTSKLKPPCVLVDMKLGGTDMGQLLWSDRQFSSACSN